MNRGYRLAGRDVRAAPLVTLTACQARTWALIGSQQARRNHAMTGVTIAGQVAAMAAATDGQPPREVMDVMAREQA